MSPARAMLLILLLVTFSGCNHLSRARQSKALLSEAADLMKQDNDVTQQWTYEFVTTFTPENRAQFPANRDFLRTHAAKIIKLVEESSRLNNNVAAKYEQAARLSGYDQRQKGMTSFAAGFRKNVEMNEILKSQMQMVSDQRIVDPRIFNEKFLHSGNLMRQKQNESQRDFAEGKRLLGL
jgi:hypothetical protein